MLAAQTAFAAVAAEAKVVADTTDTTDSQTAKSPAVATWGEGGLDRWEQEGQVANGSGSRACHRVIILFFKIYVLGAKFVLYWNV
jgi:hypothetical protein